MQRLLAAFVVALTLGIGALTSFALTPAQQVVLFSGASGYNPQADANSYADFTTNTCVTAKVVVACSSWLATTRTTAALMQAPGPYGLWTSVIAGSPRINGRGLWAEGATTQAVPVANIRDLTGWTLSPILCATVLKDQIGIDGVANSASSITLLASSCAVTLAVTQSGTRQQSMFFKLPSCAVTCTIEQSMDTAGAGYVTMDSSTCFDGDQVGVAISGTGYARCSLPPASQTNKTTGVRFSGTIGDKLSVDFVNNTAKSFVTTPMAILSQTAETLQITAATGYGFVNNGWFIKYNRLEAAGPGAGIGAIVAYRSDAAPSTDRYFLEYGSQVLLRTDNAGSTNAAGLTFRNFTNNLITYPATYKNAFGTTPTLATSAFSPNLGTGIVSSSMSAVPVAPLSAYLGSNAGGSLCYCNILQWYNVPFAPTTAQLQGYVNSP